MGRFKKLGNITSKRLGNLIGYAFTENRYSNYRNRVCEDWLPIYIGTSVIVILGEHFLPYGG